jgi:FtsZ-interacting cell division protein ZipA
LVVLLVVVGGIAGVTLLVRAVWRSGGRKGPQG